MLKIWGRISSINVRKVVWCAQELGLAFERVDAGRDFGIVQTPAYRALNPNSLVPTIEDVLDDGGRVVLWESNVVVRYLCARHASGTLYPEPLAARFDAERWMDWQLCHVLPSMITLFWGLIRTAPGERNVAAIEQARQVVAGSWRLLDEHLEGRRFVTGDRFTMGDIPIGAFAYRWLALPTERPSLPRLQAWYERLCERPAFKRHVMLPLQ